MRYYIVITILLILSSSTSGLCQDYERQILENQQRMIQLQEQQNQFLLQQRYDRDAAEYKARRDEEMRIWAWFSSLPKSEKQELIDGWNKSRPDCPWPCPSRKPKSN